MMHSKAFKLTHIAFVFVIILQERFYDSNLIRCDVLLLIVLQFNTDLFNFLSSSRFSGVFIMSIFCHLFLQTIPLLSMEMFFYRLSWTPPPLPLPIYLSHSFHIFQTHYSCQCLCFKKNHLTCFKARLSFEHIHQSI